MSSAQQRLSQISAQLASSSSQNKAHVLATHPDDVVITLALRTPLTKAKKGLLKDTPLDDLLVSLLTGVRERAGFDPSLVDEIVLGNVLHKAGAFVGRASAIAAGFPATTSFQLVNRWCSSGLLATHTVANQIKLGHCEIGIAIGAESMSESPDAGAPPFCARINDHVVAKDVIQPMGWTSENVARDFDVTREAQDEFAARSFQRAEQSQKEGWSVDEILPIETQWVDPKTGERRKITADHDDGIRYGTTKESLGKIRSAFPQWAPSTTTGGNASQLTDGAAALLMMRRSTAERLGQPILAKFVTAVVAGLEPRIMGIGPVFAIPKLLQKVGLKIDDIDIFEINEAFASMGVYCQRKLGLDPAKLNPRGGAIAFGHPLGCTGARQIVTALSELKRSKKKLAVTSMCVGTGMGMAALLVSEQ